MNALATDAAVCHKCFGLRNEDHPDWFDYWLKIADKELRLDDIKACVKFFKSRGHAEPSLPNTKIPCSHCAGTGLEPTAQIKRIGTIMSYSDIQRQLVAAGNIMAVELQDFIDAGIRGGSDMSTAQAALDEWHNAHEQTETYGMSLLADSAETITLACFKNEVEDKQ